eukprot:scaffold661117_cov98-Prasinocladus_malaysianus.AAC.1
MDDSAAGPSLLPQAKPRQYYTWGTNLVAHLAQEGESLRATCSDTWLLAAALLIDLNIVGIVGAIHR